MKLRIDLGAWKEFLEGDWRVTRFYCDSGRHHMLLRCIAPKKQLNVCSNNGYFQGLAEGDIITLGLSFLHETPVSPRDDAEGYHVSHFIVKTVNR